jgi:hypothetical protein
MGRPRSEAQLAGPLGPGTGVLGGWALPSHADNSPRGPLFRRRIQTHLQGKDFEGSNFNAKSVARSH